MTMQKIMSTVEIAKRLLLNNNCENCKHCGRKSIVSDFEVILDINSTVKSVCYNNDYVTKNYLNETVFEVLDFSYEVRFGDTDVEIWTVCPKEKICELWSTW